MTESMETGAEVPDQHDGQAECRRMRPGGAIEPAQVNRVVDVSVRVDFVVVDVHGDHVRVRVIP
jgi:hypothetical protein